MKMAVVGCEASGKTVFLCALADYYGRDAANAAERLKLTPENAAANSFERYQYRQMRCLRQWPSATQPNKTVSLKWSLRHRGRSLAEIEMLEFGGETYRAAFRDTGANAADDPSTQDLLAYLSGADFFVVLVSIKALLDRQDSGDEQDFDRETEALWVTRGILDFIRRNRPDAGVVIGLTQADRYRDEIGESGGAAALFTHCWPTVSAAAEGIPVVEVASVSKTDSAGNPAEGYHTQGIQPVMREFARHCFGDENALENGARRLVLRSVRRRNLLRLGVGLAALGAVGLLATILAFALNREPRVQTRVVEKAVTNVVEKVVEVEKLVDRPVTNVVEKVVEVEKLVDRPVTNVVEKVVEVEKLVDRPVTNIVEKVVDRPVTNVVEKIVERVVTNVVERPAATIAQSVQGAPAPESADPAPVAPAKDLRGFRIWTDHNGRKVVAKWLDVAPDQNGITLLTRSDRRIEAVLRKFSPEDQEFVRDEIKRHADLGETLSDGVWLRNPLLRKNK